MRQINEALRQRALTLSQQLEDIESERLKLLVQLDHLEVQAKAMRLEHNALHNLYAATSDFPDEILAMCFRAGSDDNPPNPNFGIVVSHVSHRWRSVALSTPCLWSRARYIAGKRHGGHPEQFDAYLSRAKMMPVDIYIAEDLKELGPHVLQSFVNHIGHCRHLCIEGVTRGCHQRLLERSTRQPAPILRFLKMIGRNMELSNPLFASVAPHLRVLDLANFEIDTGHLPKYMSAFQGVTHLRLTSLALGRLEVYTSLRCMLGELRSLSHLELKPYDSQTHLMQQLIPLELLKLQFLKLDLSCFPSALNFVITSINAPSLTSLSLIGYYDAEEVLVQNLSMAHIHFPVLRHIFLGGAVAQLSLLAKTFTEIERLTFRVSADWRDIDNQLDIMNANIDAALVAWPKLQRIEVAGSLISLVPVSLRTTILKLQQAGSPLCTLMLPQEYLSLPNALVLKSLKEVIEIKPFCDDWLSPFKIGFFQNINQ